MGAGSPSHPDGDRAKSDTGIVQGHAYSIVEAVEVDGLKMIRLRNPWGEGEWQGDWSDNSNKWTTRMKNILNYSNEDDGMFWMDFNDFYDEYDTVYVCRNLSQKKGWTAISVADRWEGKYAGGLPNSRNRDARLEDAP
jgi:hypothetical protein